MDILQTIIIFTGLAGHWFIARRDRKGYWFWIVGNLAMIAVSLNKELYGMVVLFAVYTALSLYALKNWGAKSPSNLNACQ